MREIIFRAKKLNTQEWIYGHYVHCYDILEGKDECDYIVERHDDKDFPFIKVDKITLGQYTGLNDLTDKPIFEGDIVASVYDNEKISSLGDIQFSCGVFGVEWTHTKKDKIMVGGWGQSHNLRRLDDDIIKYIKIIGNIYDSPELLETFRYGS